MQSINTTILQSSFMVVFMGTTALSVVLGIVSFIKLGKTSALYVIAGSLLIFVGVFLVTAQCTAQRCFSRRYLRESGGGTSVEGIFGQLDAVESCADDCFYRGTDFLYRRNSQDMIILV